MNELRLYLAGDEPHTGYTTVFGGDRFPTTATSSRAAPTASASRT